MTISLRCKTQHWTKHINNVGNNTNVNLLIAVYYLTHYKYCYLFVQKRFHSSTPAAMMCELQYIQFSLCILLLCKYTWFKYVL